MKNVFMGVLALDFKLTTFASFLIDNYGGSDTIVVIVEDAPPNYIIASSMRSTGIKKVLKEDETKECPLYHEGSSGRYE